jgi:hypothetical protein
MALPPILVTGAHRTGTTWTGRMLALQRDVAYIHEPFNPVIDRFVRFRRAFTYVCPENEDRYDGVIRDQLEFRYPVADEARRHLRARTLRGLASKLGASLWRRLAAARPLVKDPLAAFSAEWLATRFDMQVVVLVRHPAAFASSLKVNEYQFPFVELLEQPLLLRDLLRPYVHEVVAYACERAPIVDQAALLWKMLYAVFEQFRARHPDWIFVRHEDLSTDPVGGFRALYERLQLPWDDQVEAAVRWHSGDGSSSPPAALRRYEQQRLSSADALRSWRTRLTPDEVGRLREQVGAAASGFYGDEDW